jgi:asparaginyl-tRNA synthetase
MQQSEIVQNTLERLSRESMVHAMRIHTTVRKVLGDFFREEGFLEVPPVILSPLTDPLNHPVFDPVVTYYGKKYSLTKSMIFHKHLLVKYLGSIFTFSPNVRMETEDKKSSGRHLWEFTQIDVEKRDATRGDMMRLVEKLLPHLFREVKSKNAQELRALGRDLPVPETPFPVIKYLDAESSRGEDFERILSKEAKTPFWIVDIPVMKREFYDRMNDDGSSTLADMDLIYPEGFQEALSGGEREYKPERIRERIKLKGQTEEQFSHYLSAADEGLPPSAGFGIGIERLVRYICGFTRIVDTHPCPKLPGDVFL